MDLDKVLFLLIDTVEMSLNISIGVFLLMLNKRRKNALQYLGLFILVCGVASLSSIFEEFNVYIKTPYLNILSFDFISLIPALLYLYVEKVSLDKPRRKSYLLLIPGCLDLLFNIGTLFLSLKQRNELMDSLGYGLFTIFAFFYGFAIIVLTLRKVRRHSKQLGEQYSNTEHRDLKWLYVAIAVIISIYGLAIIFAIFLDDFISEIILSVFSLFITYWIAYHGLLQQVSVSLTSANSDAQPIDIPGNETEKAVADTDAKHQQVVKAIRALLNAEKLYLNPELTIVDLAERIGEHPRLVSTSINRLCGENFNRFINKYRVEEARLRLLNSAVAHLNMEGIGIDAGFNSNSSFYTAFKKELNMTPLQYLKNSKS